MSEEPRYSMNDALRAWLLSSSLNFTLFFFKALYKRDYVIGQHHIRIAEALDRVMRGETTRLMINMPPRYGKAISTDTPMLTTKGWKKAGEIKEGEKLFDADGKETIVLGRYPQGETENYRVRFTDGSSLITCGEHLWAVKSRDDIKRGNGWRTKKTKDLIASVKCSDGHLNWQIPSTNQLQTQGRQLPIDPYLLGCWLGDGSSSKAEITTMDKEIVEAFSTKYELSVRSHQNSGKAITYGIKSFFITRLKEAGLLKNKHIPENYILSSPEQRLALLQGLMDTDGTCNRKNSQTSLCLTNDRLRSDARTLAESLGMFVTEYKKSLFIRSQQCPFRLTRKAELWKPAGNKHHVRRYISSIETAGKGETICFTVDNELHLYLAGKDLIATHNTELAVKGFVANGLARNPRAQFIHLSYSDGLARSNSAGVQDIVRTAEYQRLFAGTMPNSVNTHKWSTKAGGGLYAVSSAGQVTGFGAGLVDEEHRENEIDAEMTALEQRTSADTFGGAIIIDDPIKPDDARSDLVREKVNQKFETTIRNRVNSRNTPIVIIMQRLDENDLCGYLQKLEPDQWEVLSLPAISKDSNGNEQPLWPFKHTLEELKEMRTKNGWVFETQYMQNPRPLEGLMYERQFKTYDTIPATRRATRKNYTDTADEGKDYHCSIDYVETEIGNFILDVLFTQKPMEFTETKQAEMMTKDRIDVAIIESNNGGRSFARNVEAQMRLMLNNHTRVSWFHQSQNKNVRIFTRSNEVQNLTYMPNGWEKMWPEFHRAITNYMKAGNNAHDDAPDALTGTIEKRQSDRRQSAADFF